MQNRYVTDMALSPGFVIATIGVLVHPLAYIENSITVMAIRLGHV